MSEQREHAAEAERLLRKVLEYPDDREELLLAAAAQWILAERPAEALPIYDELLTPASDPPPDPVSDPALVQALKVAALWDTGDERRARELAVTVRVQAPASLPPWQIIGETFEVHDDLPAAAAWLEDATDHFLTPDEVTYEARRILITRHRVRRLLGEAHDDRDHLADYVHSAPVPLDELHDPKRLWSLGSDDPAEVRREIERLRTELADHRAALSRPFPLAVLYWPEAELVALLTRYPVFAADYGGYPEHLRSVEQALHALSATGVPHLGVVTATLPTYEAYARTQSLPPATPSLPAAYATSLAARGHATPWPPPRTSPCWCGAPAPYAEHCGRPGYP
ncbi:hypothetical protein [Streptomyces sp. H39-S7]|uniref:hypothetical protein n=1 Tax=Streptomyces sp. H39-S7 TaxID=3004357 RepID=UPI0022B02B6F|nr:hypothetical protein [Streptomyces sp. H39-S7]MCZ4125083.1 hypothetical protein [Streptomyces sp. H39-S7]